MNNQIEISDIQREGKSVEVFYSFDGIDAEKPYKLTLKDYCQLVVDNVDDGNNRYSMTMPGMPVCYFGIVPTSYTYAEFYESLNSDEMEQTKAVLTHKIENEIETA